MSILETARRAIGIDTRAPIVAKISALEAKHAAAAAERQRALAEAQAAVDALEAPRKLLGRLQAEDLAASRREGDQVMAEEHKLQPPREFVGLEDRVGRALDKLRVSPTVEYAPGRAGAPETISNLPELERHRDAIALAVRLRSDLRQRSLLRLPTADLLQRLEEMDCELDDATVNTAAERA